MHPDDSRDTVATTPKKWPMEIRGAPNTTPLDTPFFEEENSSMARYPADCPEAGNEKSAKPNDMKIGPWLVFLMFFLLVFLLMWFVIIGAMELLHGN